MGVETYMTFRELSNYLEKLEKTTSRNEITRILAELFKKTPATEIDKVCYLLLGELVPAYKGIEFNLAERMMVRILARAYGVEPGKVAAMYKKSGDLGDVATALAANSKHEARNSKLSVPEVYDRLMEIATEGGAGSQGRKITKMAKLLLELDSISAKFVARIPVGRLRLGFSDVTILDALSVMEKGDKSARPQIEQAYNVTADIGMIAQHVKKGGIGSLSRVKAQPGIPIRPSLAERLPTAEKIIEKVGPKVGVEPKLDGFRTTIHIWYEGGKKQVATFSRNLENTTHMFPEIIAAARKLPVRSVILDGETIGYNPKTGKFLPFQETVQRKRKHGIEEAAKKLPLRVFVFDILYLNGRDLLSVPFIKRREILEKTLKVHQDGVKLVVQRITSDVAVVKEEFKKNITAGLEGIVAKKLDSPYRAGSRGFEWIKLKGGSGALEQLRAGGKGGLLDTVDCVVMGAYRGRGKRASFGVGGFLLGVREGDQYFTISRLGTGLSDEQFREANKRIEKLKVKEQPKEYVVVKEATPDIWAKPSLVVEILADEITLSPRHTAGNKSGRGYSLRFPRLVRFRDDKNAQDATSVKEIESMYKSQKTKG
ncbi:ATP-dependent DNA ligase [Candidatus Microgenomates bacterium]|nr:ATP-dependent DNA ligase [Candidatus Microgenomates bacterium]